LANARVPNNSGESTVVEAPHPYIKLQNLSRAPDMSFRTRLSYSIPVNIADLDLTSSSDRKVLSSRVYDAARQACRELDRRFPSNVYVPTTPETRQQCVDRAADDGMAQAGMIANARS
jgi:UrcA family protein